MKAKLINYDFDNDFKNLEEGVKKFIALGQWSLYKLDSGEYLMATDGGCKCCHDDFSPCLKTGVSFKLL